MRYLLVGGPNDRVTYVSDREDIDKIENRDVDGNVKGYYKRIDMQETVEVMLWTKA